MLLQSIPHFLIPEQDNGSFPLRHPVNNGNILYDENHNVVGVFDWTSAGSFPWECHMAPPESLNTFHFPERRKLYIDIFETREIAMTGTNRFATFMRSPASEIVNLVDENYRAYGNTFPQYRAMRLMTLIYGEGTTWESVKKRYVTWESVNAG
jgi:hypothetical protein